MTDDSSVVRDKDVRARVSVAEKIALGIAADEMQISVSELLRQGAMEKIERTLGYRVGVDDGPPADPPPPPPDPPTFKLVA